MKKLLLAIAISLLFLFKGAVTINAADFVIDCGDLGCGKSGTEPLFDKVIDGVWAPGKILTKTINLKNSSSEIKEMSIRPIRTPPINILENVMQISIVTNPGGTVIWAGNLSNFYSQTYIGMGVFNPGVNQDYKITASMDSGADNAYQDLESKFDLTLGFWETVSDLIPTSTEGGGVGGDEASATICTDTLPGGAPVLLSATSNANNSVTLAWNTAPDPVSYYLVTYGTTSGAQTYGNPNVGGHSTTSYTVSGLSGGMTYYFVVRAGNGCAPGPFSNELVASPTGGFIEGPAGGFTPGVLGVQDEEGGATQEVRGLSCTGKDYLWWLPLVIQLVIGIIIILYLRKIEHKTWRKLFVIILVLAIISQAVHQLLSCNCATSVWCPRYWVFNLLCLITTLIVLKFFQKRK